MPSDTKTEYFPSARIESLTDGIFAFAMTLLVLSLNAPELHGLVTNQELTQQIMALSGRFFIFLLSFFLLAMAWGVHHKQFAKITRSNEPLMWINMLRLLFVIMIPFSSVLVGNYSELPTAVVFFTANIFLLCVVSYIEWKYAVTHDLTEHISQEYEKVGDLKNLVTVAIAGVAVILSFLNTDIALWTFATIPLAFFVLKKVGKIG